MRPTGSSVRRAALVSGAAGVAALALLVAPAAQAGTSASPTARTDASARSAGAANPNAAVARSAVKTEKSLGTDAAGVYYDAARDAMVVNITDQGDAAAVRASGAVPRMVEHSGADLTRATRALSKSAKIAGTAWAVDPAQNTVTVTADQTVSKADMATVRGVASRFGDAVTVTRTKGTLSPTISGGQAIYGGGYRCSLGFNVRSGSTYYFLTAGHCGNIASYWYSNSSQSAYLGSTAGSSFPGNDYAIVAYTSGVSHPGTVYTYGGSQDITTAGNAYVGESVSRSGSTTGVHSGTVQALNATVNYAEGTVSGLIRTNVCAEGGDSGGSLYAGSTALGLTSGGNGNCSSGGTTYFQPVTEPLSVYGVSVY